MAKGPRFRVPFRRKREGKTDYRKRLKLLLSGKPRWVVRKSSWHILVQLIENSPEGDKVIASAHSNELRKYGWKGGTSNIPSAYLTGLLCGLKAVKKGQKKGVLDIGLVARVKKSRIFASLKGLLDAGIEIPHSEEVLPDEGRIKGEHIASYADLLKEEKKKRFSKYLERKLDPKDLPSHFDKVKGRIMKFGKAVDSKK